MASFRVEVDPEIHKATRRLPGNIRQRVLRALKGLRDEPRPAGSEALDIGEFELPPGVEPRRIRMESWRIVYVVEDDQGGRLAPASRVELALLAAQTRTVM